MKDVKITCDACNANLTDMGVAPSYRLHLLKTNFVFDAVASYSRPHLHRDYHFCDLDCLGDWIRQKLDADSEVKRT